MAKYNEEKVLYFSERKPLHLSPRERSGTDLSIIVNKAVKQGQLTLKDHNTSGRYYDITDKGRVRLLTLQIQTRKRLGKDTSEHEGKLDALTEKPSQKASRSAQDVPTPPKKAPAFAQEMLKESLLAIKLEGVLTQYHDEGKITPIQQHLLDENYLRVDASDDVGNYYVPTDKAFGFLLNSPEQPDTPLLFGDYRQQGDQLAKARLSAEAYSGVGDLYWDDTFEQGVPISTAVADLVTMQGWLAENCPSALRARHTRVSSLCNEILNDYAESLEPKQLQRLITDRVKDREGFVLDPQIAYNLSHKKALPLVAVETLKPSDEKETAPASLGDSPISRPSRSR